MSIVCWFCPNSECKLYGLLRAFNVFVCPECDIELERVVS